MYQFSVCKIVCTYGTIIHTVRVYVYASCMCNFIDNIMNNLLAFNPTYQIRDNLLSALNCLLSVDDDVLFTTSETTTTSAM